MNRKSDIKKPDKSFERLHDDILIKIRPNKIVQNKLDKAIKSLLKRINETVNKMNLEYSVKPILVGSIAKDTYLPNPDVDIFLLFPVHVSIDELRRVGLRIGQLVLPAGEERYAEHPYISGEFDGFETDIVPCFQLTNIKDRMTAVDRTPFHTKFVIEHINDSKRDDVRLLKQFMKGIDIYGAEIEVQGFSGYLCELLILKYRDFLNTLRAASRWKPELVVELNEDELEKIEIATKSGESSKSKLPKNLFTKFKNDPLVFIDPVDKTRNVASAVSLDKLKLYIHAAKNYLENPSKTFFFPNPIKPLSLKKLQKLLEINNKPIFGVEFETPLVIPDILHGQLRKCQRAIAKVLDSAGFYVVNSNYYPNHNTLILFELKNSKLSDVVVHYGPPEGHENVSSFKSKWSGSSSAVSKPFVKDHKWQVKIKREFKTPLDLLNSKIFELSVGKHITKNIQRSVQFYQNLELLKSDFKKPLTQFLSKGYPWEY